MLIRRFCLCLIALPFFSTFVAAEDELKATPISALDRKEPVDFEKEILPILRANCLACHSSTKARADLILETPKTIRVGGDEGPAVIPGKGAESRLLRVASGAVKPIMPPPKNKVGARALTSAELGLLKLWIDQGAKGEVTGAITDLTWHPLPPGHNPIFATAVSPDSAFAACGRANQVFLYDLTSKEIITRLTDPALIEEGPYKRAGIAHLDHVQSLAVHPEGDVIASGGFRCVKIWRRPQGDIVARLKSEQGDVTCVASSADGKLLATSGASGKIEIWTLADEELKATLEGQAGLVVALAFSADGALLVAAGANGMLRVWSTADGKSVASTKLPTTPKAMVVCADSKLLVTATDAKGLENVLQVWSMPSEAGSTETNAEEPVKPLREFKAHSAKISALVCVSAQDSRVLSASENGTTILWNALDGKEVRKVAHGKPVTAIAVSPDAKRIATSGADKLVRLWNAEDGKVLADLKGNFRLSRELKRQERHVKLLGDRRNDRKKAVESAGKERDKKKEAVKKAQGEIEKQKKNLEDKKKALAEAEKGKDKKKTEKAKKDFQGAESSLANAERILKEARSDVVRGEKKVTEETAAVAMAEEALKMPTASLEELKKSTAASEQHTISYLAFTSDSASLVAATDAKTLRVWQASNGRPIGIAKISGKGSAYKLASCGGGGLIAVSNGSARVSIIDATPDWQLEATIGGLDGDSPFIDRVTALGFSPDGKLLAAGGGDPSRSGEIVVINVDDGSIVWKIADAHSDTVCGLEFSAEGRYLATAGADKFVRLFNAADGRSIRFFEGHTAHVLGVSWQSDSKTLASCGADSVIKVWNVATGETKRTIKGFSKEVTAIVFVGDGQETVACSGDSSVRMHRTGDGKNFRNLSGTTDFMYSVDATADGALVVAGGYSSTLHVWNAKDGKSLASFAAPKAVSTDAEAEVK
jgi:WD40 repeat protein